MDLQDEATKTSQTRLCRPGRVAHAERMARPLLILVYPTDIVFSHGGAPHEWERVIAWFVVWQP